MFRYRYDSFDENWRQAIMISHTELSRLRWRCRRGTRELDLLFDRFLRHAYSLLSAEEQTVFEDFLGVPDPIILDWVTGKAEPENGEYLTIIQHLRSRSYPLDPGNNDHAG